MELLLSEIKAQKDVLLIIEIAERLGIKTKRLTDGEKEDIGFANAIKQARKSGYVSEQSVLNELRKIGKRK